MNIGKYTISRCILLAAGLVFTSLQSSGQTINEYLQMAADNNPQLQVDFKRYLAAVEKAPQVGALPDPEVTIGYFTKPMMRFMGEQRADISLMQMFPWFGMIKTQKNEAALMAQVQYQNFLNAKNQLFYDVKSVWYDLYTLEKKTEITSKNLELLSTVESVALTRYQNGDTGGSGMSDVLWIKMEIKELKNTLALLKDNKVPLLAKFNKLLNRPAHASVALPDTLAPQVFSMEETALLDSIISNNPMIAMLKKEGEALEVRKSMAKKAGMPVFGLGVNYSVFSPRTENGMAMGGKNMLMPMATFTIPIYRKKYTAMHKEAELLQQSTQSQVKAAENELTVQLSESLRNLKDAQRRVSLYQEQSELARQSLNILLAAYSTKGAAFDKLLSIHRQLLDYEMKLHEAIAEQNRTVAMIDMLLAVDISRQN